jgi:hypothetical protein
MSDTSWEFGTVRFPEPNSLFCFFPSLVLTVKRLERKWMNSEYSLAQLHMRVYKATAGWSLGEIATGAVAKQWQSLWIHND